MPDLDHARRDQHVQLSGGEARHRLALFLRAHLTVHHADPEVAELRRPPSRSASRVAARAWSCSDSSTSGHTTKHWRPSRRRPRMNSYAPARSVLRHHPRLDRPPAARQLAQGGRVEIAVERQRQRARDRRRGHVQDVGCEARACLAVERRALAHAEAVLLVDDRERQPARSDRILDQRVGADQQAKLAGGEPLEHVAPLTGRGRAGQEPDRRAQPGRLGAREEIGWHEALDRRVVLLGERLRRRHQRRLHPRLGHTQHRVERDDGLAGSRPRPSAAAASAGP